MKTDDKKTVPAPTAVALDDAHILATQSKRDDSDILGSYTGTPADGEIPEQDADDL